MPVNVLIVEDNPVASGFLRRVVNESFSDDMTVTEADDLEAARKRIAVPPAGPFKLILVDLELPDGNGLELLAELVRYPATKIVTTLFSDDEHLFPALQRGADGYLLKEDRFEVLVEELQRIVRGQPPLSPAIARRLLTHFRDGYSVAGGRGLHEIEPLTPRETEVLTSLSKGFTIKEIANMVGIKGFAVNDHIKAIYKKLNASVRAEALMPASRSVLS